MATSTFPTPEQFDFAHPEQWPRWIKRFLRYRAATNLSEKDGETQISTLIYCMGDRAEDILATLKFTERERNDFNVVVGKLQSHFVKKRNVIYERACFNQRVQQVGEPVDNFITSLYHLAEHCQFKDLREELIRDRIVVGLQDARLSEKLQLDPELTLEKAITVVRQSESVKKQQQTLRAPAAEIEVDWIQSKGKPPKKQCSPAPPPVLPGNKKEACQRCGRSPLHNRQNCPAKEERCFRCNKMGHFGAVCKSKEVSTVTVEQTQETHCQQDSLFLATLTSHSRGSSPWVVEILVNGYPVDFKVDTGADVTVVPENLSTQWKQALDPSQKSLKGPNNARLDVVGQFLSTLQRGDKTVQETVYVIKQLTQPLLGRPSIEKLGILSRIDTVSSHHSHIVDRFPEVFSGLGKLSAEYHIELREDAKPYAFSTSRRVAIPLLPAVKQELERMESMGVISRIQTPTDWCAGMVIVPKSNGEIRICVDLTKLNEWIKRPRHILPAVEETLAKLQRAKIFTKLDANSGFWQVPLTKESAVLTTFITPFGRFYFNRLPFGIASAPEYFQNEMTKTLEDLPGQVCQMDDILVYGETQEEHDSRLQEVLKRLQSKGVTLNKDKCEFSVPAVKFLGQIISQGGVKPDPEKIKGIVQMPAPTCAAEVRRVLGMINQQAKFVPDLAHKTEPLRALLAKDAQWIWDAAQQKSFQTIKEDLTSPPVLALYDPERETKLSTDASCFGLGAVLRQRQPTGDFKPVAYASRSMSQAERRYAQIEKEALGIAWGAERFSQFLIGKEFEIQTDHKPLVPLLGSRGLDELPVRVQRFRMRLLRFKYTISHVPGKELVVADTLSRQPAAEPESADAIAEAEVTEYVHTFVQCLPVSDSCLNRIISLQDKDAVCSRVKQFVSSTAWEQHLRGELKVFWNVRDELHIENNILLRGSRIVIPQSMREEVLNEIHGSHQGITKCRERAKHSVWWPHIGAQMESLVSNCPQCCRERRNPAEPLIPTPFPNYPWQKVATDLFEWKGRQYILVVDYFSRFIETALLTGTSSNAVVNHLKSIFARQGIPEEVVSDNGPQYDSEVFRAFAREYKFQHTTSSPKFPQANGEAERAVETVKTLLRKKDDPYLALLNYRATPLCNGYSPAELLMSRRIRTTVPTMQSQLLPKVPDLKAISLWEERHKQAMKETFDERHGAKEQPPLTPGMNVWIPDRRQHGRVLSSASVRSYMVETPSGQIRRNRRSLNPVPTENVEDSIPHQHVQRSETNPETSSPSVSSSATLTATSDGSTNGSKPEDQPPMGQTVLSSGRVSRPPVRLDL